MQHLQELPLTDESASELQATGAGDQCVGPETFVLWVQGTPLEGPSDGCCCSCSGVSTTVGDIDTGSRTIPPPDSRLSSRSRSEALSLPLAPRQPLRGSSVDDRGVRAGRFLAAPETSAFRGLTTTAALGPRSEICSGGTRGGSLGGHEGGEATSPTGRACTELRFESSLRRSFSFSPSEERETAVAIVASSSRRGSGSVEDCEDDDFPMPESVSEDDGLAESLPPPPSERLRSEWPPFSDDSDVSGSRAAGSSSSSSDGIGSRWPVKGLMRCLVGRPSAAGTASVGVLFPRADKAGSGGDRGMWERAKS